MIIFILSDLLLWQLVAIVMHFSWFQAIPNVLYLLLFTRIKSIKTLVTTRLFFDLYLLSILIYYYPSCSYAVASVSMLGLITNVCLLQKKYINHIIIVYSLVYSVYFMIFNRDIILISTTLSTSIVYFFSQRYLTFTINNHSDIKTQVVKYIKSILELKDVKYKHEYSTEINIFISYCIKEGYNVDLLAFCPKIHGKLTNEVMFLAQTLDIKYDYYDNAIVINNLDEGVKNGEF